MIQYIKNKLWVKVNMEIKKKVTRVGNNSLNVVIDKVITDSLNIEAGDDIVFVIVRVIKNKSEDNDNGKPEN